MARALTSPLHVARHLLMSDAAWLFFVEIPASNGGYFRLVRNSRAVVANGVTWQAASIEIELPAEEGDGALGELRLSIPNISRLPIAYVELETEASDGELLGFSATCWLQHEDNLAAFDPASKWTQLILAAEADERRLVCECGHRARSRRGPGPVFTRRQFPQLLAQSL